MTAFACLRVLPPVELHSRPGLEGLINRYALSFLETRWCWPRRFDVISLSSFLLADPRELHLDPREIQDLAYDLQLRLFGQNGAGEVELAVFEGDAAEVARFASLEPHQVRLAANGGAIIPPLAGKLTRVTAADIIAVPLPTAVAPAGEAEAGAGAGAGAADRTAPDVRTPVYHGVYFAAKDTFVGSALSSREEGFDVVDGFQPNTREAARRHDKAVISLAGDVLTQHSRLSGMLYLPLCYAPLIHRQERDDYKTWLNALPQDRRNNLAVAVYDTPRDPSFAALSQIKAFLDGYFKVVDLQTFDPDFAVERLAPNAVQSVTLVLPEAGQLARIAAIRRFSERMDLYRLKRIWPAISNVRNAVEFETCLARRIPFVSGRAVSGTMTHPLGVYPFPAGELPIDDRVLRNLAARPGPQAATA